MADLFGEEEEDNNLAVSDKEDEGEEDDILDMGDGEAEDLSDVLVMRFCPHDSSMLYPQEDKSTKTLRYACKLCRYNEPTPNLPLVYRNERQKKVTNILHTVPSAIADDPTLARSQQANCSNCGHNEAVFFQSDVAQALALIFVCCNCGHKWVG